MALEDGVYCEKKDLRIGDLLLPRHMGDGSSFINTAAEEIDAAIGHIYQTPIAIPDEPENRPSRLMLKKINWLLASGRLVLDLATSGENVELHSYGKRMLDEGLLLLERIANGDIILIGAPPLNPDDPDATPAFTGPMIKNEDDESLVQAFYDMANPGLPIRFDRPSPYEGTRA